MHRARPIDDESGDTQEIDVPPAPLLDPDAERERWEEYLRTRVAEDEKERFITFSEDEIPPAAVLGISSPVTLWELRRIYHDLIFQFHPDRVVRRTESERTMASLQARKVNEAYGFFKKKYRL